MKTKLEDININISKDKKTQLNNNLKEIKLKEKNSNTSIATYNCSISMEKKFEEIKEENQGLRTPISHKNFYYGYYDFLEEMDKAMEEVILDDKIDSSNEDEENVNNSLINMNKKSSQKIDFKGTFMPESPAKIKERCHHHHHKNKHNQCHQENDHV